MNNHRWSDVSYHGSPFYQCDFCGFYKHDKKVSSLPCKKAQSFLDRERQEKINKERSEYQSMLRERKRWIYLKNKYGKAEDEV